MKSSLCVVNGRRVIYFRIVDLILVTALPCLILVAANTSASAQTTSTSSPADWIEFHRDNMQRWNPYETVLGVNNVGSLQLKWKNPIGASTGGVGFTSSPAVVNGVIYFGSDDGTVYALNASTGAKLWSLPIGSSMRISPAVANGVVYVKVDGAPLLPPEVLAVNANTGLLLWGFDTNQNVVSAPAVVNGVVYVAAGSVHALNAGTGALLWSYTTASAVESSPAVANGMVYVGSADAAGHVYALNASTGALLWSFVTGGIVTSSPAVANGVVYVGSEDGHFFALNASTGAYLWSYFLGNSVRSSPAVANGVVYIGSGDRNVYALNASTGALLWRYATGGDVTSSPAVANGVVYVGSSDGNVYALNASTGAKLWNFDAGVAVDSSPTVTQGVVYIHAGDLSGHGIVYAFSVGADLFLRINPSTTTVHQGDLLTYAFPVWNLGPANANHEVLNTQVPAGTTFDYIRISGTPGLGTCAHPPFGGTGQIVCHENATMAPNTTWTVRLTVMVTASAGTMITTNAATMSDSPDPNTANNMATVSLKVQ